MVDEEVGAAAVEAAGSEEPAGVVERAAASKAPRTRRGSRPESGGSGQASAPFSLALRKGVRVFHIVRRDDGELAHDNNASLDHEARQMPLGRPLIHRHGSKKPVSRSTWRKLPSPSC